LNISNVAAVAVRGGNFTRQRYSGLAFLSAEANFFGVTHLTLAANCPSSAGEESVPTAARLPPSLVVVQLLLTLLL